MAALARTEAEINAAKRGQIARLGGPDLPRLKRKKCKMGKSCGASCIPAYHVCMVDIPWALNPGLNKAVAAIRKIQGIAPVKKPAAKPVAKAQVAKPVAKVPAAKTPVVGAEVVKPTAKAPVVNLPVKAKEVYDIIDSPGFKLKDVDGSKAAKSIDWNAVGKPNAVQMGEGRDGAFYKVPNGALGRNIGIKAGEIGLHEAEALKIVGKADLGPKFIAAQHGEFFIKKSKNSGEKYTVATGRIAMGVVQGTPQYKSPSVVNGVETRDAYWTARAKIHRLGVAHNDTHGGNTIIDNKGVARFVDLGLAQVTHKAALAEAFGGASRSGADFQAERLLYAKGEGKIFKLIKSNIQTVEEAMRADGLSGSDISRFKDTDLRRKDEFYTTDPSWSKITEQQAKKYIDLLYDGV